MNKAFIYFLLLFVTFTQSFAQEDFRKSFSDFSKSSRQLYEDYSQEADRDFAEALKGNWESFKVFDARSRAPLRPLSDTLLQACPIENGQIDITDVPENRREARIPLNSTDGISFFRGKEKDGCDIISFPFYGIDVKCSVPAGYKSLHLEGISEKAVSSFFYSLSNKDADPLSASIRKCCNESRLNDWALFELVMKLSSELYPSASGNEWAVFTVFCMNRLGYNCRIARTSSSLIPLFAAHQEIYGRKYIVLDGVKYYLAGKDTDINELNTYQIEIPGTSANLDMNVADNPRIGDSSRSLQKINSSVFNDSFSLPVSDSLISFYNDYPQVDVIVYAMAEPDENFTLALVESVGPKLAGKTSVDALNTLLSFVQKDFRYRTDTDQFGREKPYFCEENFIYPYNDCEDRAVLFSFLVRKLLGYECLLLEYADHINCAVRIDEDSAGYYVRRGDRKYYVCDPTCQGARVGMSGKNYRVKPVRIWVL